MWIDQQILENCSQQVCYAVFSVDKPMVVCGNANDPSREANMSECERLGISVVKRIGGGGTVLLDRNSLIVSVGAWVRSPYDNKKYFDLLNQSVIDTLALYDKRFAELSQAGLSDIVLGPKKIAGTSMFRSRQYLLYQASILMKVPYELIDQALQHPSREPDYRGGRSHRDFLQGLDQIIGDFDRELLVQFVAENFEGRLRARLGDEFVPIQQEHLPHLLKRATAT